MSQQEQLARKVVRRLRELGHSAYFVGGCVRDLLMGLEPKDYDVVTSATPDQLSALYPDAYRVGAHFGVLLIRDQDAQVEVATYRTDIDYRDGRRPTEVRFEIDPREDAIRRDFTINALLLDPESGEVLDFVGGGDDLRQGIVRAIGEPHRRFAEDRLRMLRAIRFAARFGFTIEPKTFRAIQDMAPHIHEVSAERIRDELVRILTEGGARRGLELLDESGLLQQILPEVSAMKGVQQPPEFHPEGDVWTHTLIMLEGLQQPSPELAMGVLLHDVGKPPTFQVRDRIRFDGHVEAGVEIATDILSRLRFSREQSEQIEALIANHMKFKDAPRMKDSTLKRFLRLPEFDEHLELHRLDCLSSHGSLENYDYVQARRTEFGQEQIAPPRLLTGADLIDEGWTPGPDFGEALRVVEDAQLEGSIHTREEALELASSVLRERLRDRLD
ncbi:MAG TPA: CCA tRNA nucleotidyltransferase [Bryobacteraceae bacterium]|nr:CCA tRNA nucleotidyltransferase [Bryobacteraceae bacterium]